MSLQAQTEAGLCFATLQQCGNLLSGYRFTGNFSAICGNILQAGAMMNGDPA
jgi:hypothetical protein